MFAKKNLRVPNRRNVLGATLATLGAIGLVACSPVSGADGPEGSDDTPVIATAIVPAGSDLRVTLETPLSSATSTAGQPLEMSVSQAVVVDNRVVIPSGAIVLGRIASAEPAERPQKPGRLVLEATALEIDGQRVPISSLITAKGSGSHKDDAEDIGIGAAAGGVLGAILGGGKGALAGVVVGGAGTFLATKGEELELPRGTELIVRLEEPAQVPLPS